MTPARQYVPTVQLTRHETVYGPVFRAANPFAEAIAGLVGSCEIPGDRLAFIKELGFRVEVKG